MNAFLPILLAAVPQFALHLLYAYDYLYLSTHIVLLLLMPPVYVLCWILSWQIMARLGDGIALPRQWRSDQPADDLPYFGYLLTAVILTLPLVWILSFMVGRFEILLALVWLYFLYPLNYLAVAILLLEYGKYIER